jgi:hypothetical protein
MLQWKRVPRTEEYQQLCVWHGCTFNESDSEDFTQMVQNELKCQNPPKIVGVVETLPDLDADGNPVPDTGGRHDFCFFVHQDDIGRFAVPRLAYGIRWWEDVAKYNNNAHIYPEDFREAYPVVW